MCFIFWKTRWNRQTHHLSHHIPRTQIQFTGPGGPGMISLQKDLVWWENFGFRRTSSWSLPFGDKLKRVSMERVFTSLYVTICDMMRVVALCDYMWTGLFVVYIYIYTHSTLTWLYVSVKLAILQFTWQYITVQRLLPWIMSRVHIDEFGNGLLCRVWGANHLGPERLCKWHVASPHVDILGIWQGYVYIYIYVCNMHVYMYIYIYNIYIYI
jgi:hypothetical protein